MARRKAPRIGQRRKYDAQRRRAAAALRAAASAAAPAAPSRPIARPAPRRPVPVAAPVVPAAPPRAGPAAAPRPVAVPGRRRAARGVLSEPGEYASALPPLPPLSLSLRNADARVGRVISQREMSIFSDAGPVDGINIAARLRQLAGRLADLCREARGASPGLWPWYRTEFEPEDFALASSRIAAQGSRPLISSFITHIHSSSAPPRQVPPYPFAGTRGINPFVRFGGPAASFTAGTVSAMLHMIARQVNLHNDAVDSARLALPPGGGVAWDNTYVFFSAAGYAADPAGGPSTAAVEFGVLPRGMEPQVEEDRKSVV